MSEIVVKNKTYIIVWLTLMFLTALTVGVSYVKLGNFGNVLVGVTIACIKASVVALFFMHLKFEDKVFYITALFPLLLFCILLIFSMSDLYVVYDHIPEAPKPHGH